MSIATTPQAPVPSPARSIGRLARLWRAVAGSDIETSLDHEDRLYVAGFAAGENGEDGSAAGLDGHDALVWAAGYAAGAAGGDDTGPGRRTGLLGSMAVLRSDATFGGRIALGA